MTTQPTLAEQIAAVEHEVAESSKRVGYAHSSASLAEFAPIWERHAAVLAAAVNTLRDVQARARQAQD